MPTPGDIIDYWFSERCRKRWFESTQAFDEEIRDRFEQVWQRARSGELDDWKETAEGCLALAIILDQLPLNMFRGRPESFATEAMAREVSRVAIERGFDKGMDESHRLFLYLPYMHSEDPADQDMSVTLFEKACMETRWALHHRDIVRRFGRFPHRNEILGRQNSEEESAYLASEGAFRG